MKSLLHITDLDPAFLRKVGFVLDEADQVVGRWTVSGVFVNGSVTRNEDGTGSFTARLPDEPAVTGVGYDADRIQRMEDTPRYKRIQPAKAQEETI